MTGAEVTATTTELPESRIRLEATVPAELLQSSLDRAAREVGRGMRVPGFRAGKIPPQMVLQRVGREAVLDEAIRVDINEWYDRALRAAGVNPVGQPEVDLGEMPKEGEPLTFTAEVAIVPVADASGLGELEVGQDDPEVDTEAVDAELEQLRDRFARLETVDRAAEEGDFAVIDYLGKKDGEPFAGGEGKQQMLELGSGRFIPGFEEQVVGLAAGDETTINVTFPEQYQAEELAGAEATFDIVVHEIKAKQMPELDDDFALEVGGVDTLAELRADIESRLGEAEKNRQEQLFRLATLDSAALKAGVEIPDAIAYEHAHQEFHRMMHRFEHQGISQEIYLQSVGKTHDEMVEEAVPSAAQQLRRQSVVTAVVAAEKIEVGDEEIEDAVRPLAEREKMSLKKALSRLQSTGQLDALRSDLAEQKAVDLLVDRAKRVSVAEAKKAGAAWVPSRKEQAENPGAWAV